MKFWYFLPIGLFLRLLFDLGIKYYKKQNFIIKQKQKFREISLMAKESTFPFTINNYKSEYSLVANIESEKLYPVYFEFFESLGYSGNGYTWAGHIIQILENTNPFVLENLTFEPEAGLFAAYSNSMETIVDCVEILNPIFSNFTKLEEWVKKADRTKIDD